MRSFDRFCLYLILNAFPILCTNPVWAEDRFSDRIVRWISPSARAMEAEIETLRQLSRGLPEPERFNRSESMGYHSRRFGSPDEVRWVEVDLKKEQEIDRIAILPVFVEIPLFEGQSYGFPVRFKIEVFNEDRSQSLLVADRSGEDYRHTEGYPFGVRLPETVRGRYIRMTSLAHFKVMERWVFAISEIMALRGPINLAAGCPVEVGPSLGFRMMGWSPETLTDFQSPLGPPSVPDFSPTNGFLCQHAPGPEVLKWMQVDLGELVPVDAIRLLPSRPTDYVDIPGLGFPARFKIEFSNRPDFQTRQLIFDSGPDAYPNPGDNPVQVLAGGKEARYVRITATELRYQGTLYSFSLGELQVYSGGKNVARGKAVSASDVFDNPRFPRWKLSGLVDGYNSQNRLVELPDWLAGLEQRRQLNDRLLQLEEERERKGETIVVFATAGTLAVSGILVVGALGFSISYRRKKSKETEVLRRQIARDLHDDIGGDLGGIFILSEGALQQEGLSSDVREDLQDIYDIAKDSGEAMRDIVWLIRDERNLEELVLHLRGTAHLQLRKIPHTCEVQPKSIPSRPVSLKVRRHVLFSFKEVLTNIQKHAEARHVEIKIKLSATQPLLKLRIVDDGKGFDPDRETMGQGLENLRRRCQALKGNFEILSKPGNGTQIDLSFSLKV